MIDPFDEAGQAIEDATRSLSQLMEIAVDPAALTAATEAFKKSGTGRRKRRNSKSRRAMQKQSRQRNRKV